MSTRAKNFQMAMRLRKTLELATYKVKHGIETVPFAQLEAAAQLLTHARQNLPSSSPVTAPLAGSEREVNTLRCFFLSFNCLHISVPRSLNRGRT